LTHVFLVNTLLSKNEEYLFFLNTTKQVLKVQLKAFMTYSKIIYIVEFKQC